MQRGGLGLSLAALPFELARGIGLGGVTVTNVELLLGGALGLWLLRLLAEGRRPELPGWLALGAGGLVLILLVAAALADPLRGVALKLALRQAQGCLLAFAVADTLRRDGAGAARVAVGGLLAGGALSAALGLAELSEHPAVLALLAPFKTELSTMGGLLRLSGTLSYTNTAAMYFEALLPAALVGVALAPGRRAAALSGGAAALLLLAALLTFSRAALGTCLALLLLGPLLIWRGLGGRAGRRAGLAAAGLAGLILGLTALSPTFRLRLIEPDVARWYGAAYLSAPAPELAPGELRRLPITVENVGRVAWEPGGPRPVRLSYHWVDAASGALVRYEGRRTELPGRVGPGEAVALEALVQAPAQPGRYLLVWDMVRERIGRGWFSQMGIAPAEVPVTVVGDPLPAAAAPPPDPPSSPRAIAALPGPPGRRALWGAALGLWAERPLLGQGPDVFRHIYGPRLGLARFDDRVHTNSLYLEILTGAGLLGLAAFAGLAGAAGWAGWRQIDPPAAGAPQHMPEGGRAGAALSALALLGLAAFLIHGLLDVFLAFTPTYGLAWALLGLLGGAHNRL